MSDISKTRRWGGRAMLLAGALALPLTASISYAETVPAPPVPPSAELPPAPPAPPAPPKAPTAPLAWTQEGGSGETAGTAEDGETERRVIIERDAREGSDGKTIVIRTKDKDGKVRLTERKVQHMAFFSDDGEVLTEAEIEKLEKQIEKRMKLKEKDFEAIGQDIEKRMEMQFGKDFEERLGRKMCSDEDQRNVSIQTRDGAMKIATCAKAFIADTRTLVTHSLKKAREAIKMERNLTDEQRSEALKGIDEAISELNARG